MTDIWLFNTTDGGEINHVNGEPELTGGFETMIYLCLFGGNLDDDGTEATKKYTWWGNIDEQDPDKIYVSRTQDILRGIPLITGNLPIIKAAVLEDLKVFSDAGIANKIEVTVSIPALNTLKIEGSIEADGLETQFEFTENWVDMRRDPKSTDITAESVGEIAPPPETGLVSFIDGTGVNFIDGTGVNFIDA